MVSFFKELKTTIFGILVWIPFGMFYLPILLLAYIYYLVVELCAKHFHPELIPISKCDALVTPGPSKGSFGYMYDCQIWKVKGLVDVNEFKNHFYQCFLSTEEDRQNYRNLFCHFVQYLGYVFKKPVTGIDLNWHIHEHNLCEGESIESFVGKWMVTHDNAVKGKLFPDTERPTWMVKIIPELSRKETTVLFKLHHGLADGYTMVHLVDKLSGQKSPYLFKDPLPSRWERMNAQIRIPYLGLMLWRQMYVLRKNGVMLTENNDKIEKQNWLITLGTLDLESVKTIRRITQTNFASVLLSLQIGALRRFLEEVKPDAKLLIDSSKSVIGHSMGWPEHPVPTNGGGMTNHLTYLGIEASFHIADPLERLQGVQKSLDEMKSLGFHAGMYYECFRGIKYLSAYASRMVIAADLSLFAQEVAISSLLGSSNQHSLLGHQVENIWLPAVVNSMLPAIKTVAVGFSHSGQLDVSINAEVSLVMSQENLDRLLKVHFMEELEALRVRCQCQVV